MHSPQQANRVYGFPAYPLRIHLEVPFRYGVLTPMMEEYNFDMSYVRVTVWWLFGDIINDNFLDFKENLKIGISSVGKYILYVHFLIMPLPAYLDPPSLQYYFNLDKFSQSTEQKWRLFWLTTNLLSIWIPLGQCRSQTCNNNNNEWTCFLNSQTASK